MQKTLKSEFHVFSWFPGLQNLDVFSEIILEIIFRQKDSLWNSRPKYIGNKMMRQFQKFSVSLSNTLVKNLPKTWQKPILSLLCKLYSIILTMASAYLSILSKAMICFFNFWDYLFYLNYIIFITHLNGWNGRHYFSHW